MRSLTHIIKCFYRVYGACFHQQFVIYPSHDSFSFKIWSVVLQCFTTLCWFPLYREVNQLCVYPLCSRSPPHSGHHRALRRALRPIQQALISHPFHTE